MKSLVEFKEFYKGMYDDLLQLDATRISILNYIRLLVVIFFCIFLFAVFLFEVTFKKISISINELAIGTLIFSVIIFGVLLSVFLKMAKAKTLEFDNAFKIRFILPLISFINENLEYNFDASISAFNLKESMLFPFNPKLIDFTSGEGYISGKLDSVFLQSSYVSSPPFKGFFFVADFDKHFNSETYVLPDFSQKLFGFAGKGLQKMNIIRGELVNLENPTFEKMFSVYSNNQIMSRYMLTTDLMDEIVDFCNIIGRRIYISFINTKIYIAVPSFNLFDPNINKSVLDFGYILKFFTNISKLIEIVEMLDTNELIWGEPK